MNRDLVMNYLNNNCAKEDLKDVWEQFRRKNKDFVVECLLQLKNSNLDQIEQMLDDAYQLRAVLTNVLHDLNDRDHFFYELCCYINTWNLFSKILETEDEKEELNLNIQTILEDKPVARELLQYLYKNPRAEYSSISKTFKHYNDLGTIENVLNIICDKNIVYKMSIGNNAVYDLTENSRRWVEKNIGNHINMMWSVGIFPGNNVVTVQPEKFFAPVMTEKKFSGATREKKVYVAKVQTQEIGKFRSKNDIVFGSISMKFGNSMGKDGKHGELALAGLFKRTK